MAIIYTQLQRKADSKWVTVSYSDEDPSPYYHEHGEGHETQEAARAAWENSDERKRLFPKLEPLSAAESATLEAALVLLKRGEVALAGRALSGGDQNLADDIRAFISANTKLRDVKHST